MSSIVDTIMRNAGGGTDRETGLLNNEPHYTVSNPSCCPTAFHGGAEVVLNELIPVMNKMADVLRKHQQIRALKIGEEIRYELYQEMYSGYDTRMALRDFAALQTGGEDVTDD